jgi:hypothetical protein
MVIKKYLDEGEKTNKVFTLLLKNYNSYLQLLNPINIENFKEIIYGYDLEIKSENIKYFNILYKTYTAIAIFPSEDNVKAFKDIFPLKKIQLIWIGDVKAILEEINKINIEGFYFIPVSDFIMHYYALYLPCKIRQSLLKALELEREYDGLVQNEAKITLFKTLQNFKNRSKNGEIYIKDEFEEFLLDVFEALETCKMDEYLGVSAEKIVKIEASSKVEGLYLKPLYDLIVADESKKNMPKKEVALFNLFRLMLKDRDWKTEEEFYHSIEIDENGNPNVKYGNSYRRYQTKTMQKFFKKK